MSHDAHNEVTSSFWVQPSFLPNKSQNALYDRYGAAWDDRLFQHVQARYGLADNAPCNLHSCGPSSHLYECVSKLALPWWRERPACGFWGNPNDRKRDARATMQFQNTLYERWGAHPRNRNIAVLQTRLIPGTVARLRASLPNTQLELTPHPPHFDVANATPEELRDVLWNSARDAGYRDVYLNMFAVVHRAEDLGKVERNLQACSAVMSEIRQQSWQRSNPIQRMTN